MTAVRSGGKTVLTSGSVIPFDSRTVELAVPGMAQALGIAFVQTPGVAPSVRGAGLNQLVFENMTDNPVGTGLSKPLQIGSIGEAGVYLTAMVHGLDGGRTLLFSYTVYRD